MNFDIHYETEYCNLQGHGSLTLIHLYSNRMTLGVLSTKNLITDMNYAFSYGIILAHRDIELIPRTWGHICTFMGGEHVFGMVGT